MLAMVSVYIDETGLFIRGPNGKGISGVGALAIPDCSWPKILKKYNQIRPTLLNGNNEVKGRSLNEAQVAKVIDILRRNDALFECTLIDMEFEDPLAVKVHQEQQAVLFGNSVTDEHHPNVRKYAADKRSDLILF
jgi:hypothetical protein